MSSGDLQGDKLDALVALTEEAQKIADTIGVRLARAAYHLEAARQEIEAAAGHANSLLPRVARAEDEPTRPLDPASPDGA